MERLLRAAREGRSAAGGGLAIGGPSGSGKSELLRQLAIALLRGEPKNLPIYLDLTALASGAAPNPAAGEEEMRRALFRSVLRQALAWSGRMELFAGHGLEADPARLAGFCYGAGLSGLAPFATQAMAHLSGLEAWRALLRALRAPALAPLVLIVDGAAGTDDPALGALGVMLIEGARREGCPVFCEAAAVLGEDPQGLETLALAPLDLADALALAQSLGRDAPPDTKPIASSTLRALLPRLGPWPGWVRGWASLLRAEGGLHPIRAAEEAYVEFLRPPGRGPDGSAANLNAVPLSLRERALQAAWAALERPEPPLDHAEIAGPLGLPGDEAEALLQGLTELGLLTGAARAGAARDRRPWPIGSACTPPRPCRAREPTPPVWKC